MLLFRLLVQKLWRLLSFLITLLYEIALIYKSRIPSLTKHVTNNLWSLTGCWKMVIANPNAILNKHERPQIKIHFLSNGTRNKRGVEWTCWGGVVILSMFILFQLRLEFALSCDRSFIRGVKCQHRSTYGIPPKQAFHLKGLLCDVKRRYELTRRYSSVTKLCTSNHVHSSVAQRISRYKKIPQNMIPTKFGMDLNAKKMKITRGGYRVQ